MDENEYPPLLVTWRCIHSKLLVFGPLRHFISNSSMKTLKSSIIIRSVLCLVYFICCDSDSRCLESEVKALLEFKKTLIDESNCLESWVGNDCCKWDGVYCKYNTSNVFSLSLNNLPCSVENPAAVLGGEINPCLSNLTHLDTLVLSNNKFNGSLPTSIGQLEMLSWLDVSNNSLTGVVSELHFAKLSNLTFLNMESKMLVWNVSSKWVPPFQLDYINLGSCRLGPEFPPWLESQKFISQLWLSNTSISKPVPDWFERLVLPTVSLLDLSNNEITGKVFEFQKANEYVFLGSNKFEFLFQRFPLTTKVIDLSNNLLTGQFPRTYDNQNEFGTYSLTLANNNLRGHIPKYLCLTNITVIDLSKNQLSGELPSCIGSQEYLFQLDLSSNNLVGRIPDGFFSSKSKSLQSLHLNNNKFKGRVPSSLQNLTFLQLIDFSGNFFNDNIPGWLGTLVWLKALNLQSNKFDGHIPETLCALPHLQVLNLGQNNLTGKIPSCFGNFTAMISSIDISDPFFVTPLSNTTLVFFPFTEHIASSVKGTDRLYTSTLPYLMSIDLSNNNITGEIPSELVNLVELRNLNLSGNRLQGKIPKKIGHLKNLESLDLSKNQLFRNIPISLSNLNYLSHLNLSYNNLSGRIPGGNQLQTLNDPSIYMGNKLLCGQLIFKSCSDERDESVNQTDNHIDKNTDHNEDETDDLWFYAGMGPGLFVGLVGFCTVLLCNKSWSYRYFGFIEKCYIRVLTAVETTFQRRS